MSIDLTGSSPNDLLHCAKIYLIFWWYLPQRAHFLGHPKDYNIWGISIQPCLSIVSTPRNWRLLMYRSWNHPLLQPIYRQSYHVNRIALTWFRIWYQVALQTMTSQLSIASSSLLMRSRRPPGCHISGLILSDLWQSQLKPWISLFWVYRTISTNKRILRKERIPLFADFSKCYFQICSVKIKKKHKSISNASLCWIIPTTFSWKYASYWSAHSWKRQYYHHDSNLQSSIGGWMSFLEVCLAHQERIPASA